MGWRKEPSVKRKKEESGETCKARERVERERIVNKRERENKGGQRRVLGEREKGREGGGGSRGDRASPGRTNESECGEEG